MDASWLSCKDCCKSCELAVFLSSVVWSMLMQGIFELLGSCHSHCRLMLSSLQNALIFGVLDLLTASKVTRQGVFSF